MFDFWQSLSVIPQQFECSMPELLPCGADKSALTHLETAKESQNRHPAAVSRRLAIVVALRDLKKGTKALADLRTDGANEGTKGLGH